MSNGCPICFSLYTFLYSSLNSNNQVMNLCWFHIFCIKKRITLHSLQSMHVSFNWLKNNNCFSRNPTCHQQHLHSEQVLYMWGYGFLTSLGSSLCAFRVKSHLQKHIIYSDPFRKFVCSFTHLDTIYRWKFGKLISIEVIYLKHGKELYICQT